MHLGLAFIERLSSLRRLQCTSIILKVCPYREVYSYCVLYSEVLLTSILVAVQKVLLLVRKGPMMMAEN